MFGGFLRLLFEADHVPGPGPWSCASMVGTSERVTPGVGQACGGEGDLVMDTWEFGVVPLDQDGCDRSRGNADVPSHAELPALAAVFVLGVNRAAGTGLVTPGLVLVA